MSGWSDYGYEKFLMKNPDFFMLIYMSLLIPYMLPPMIPYMLPPMIPYMLPPIIPTSHEYVRVL
jgi:hypothetical protein